MMLKKKFFSGSFQPVVADPYYNGVARSGSAGAATVVDGVIGGADLVISKRRNGIVANAIFDRVRGPLNRLTSTSTAVEAVDTDTLTAFTGTGFTVGADTPKVINAPISAAFMYWCFKEAAEFLDIQEYTGNNLFSKTITHGLTVPPELVIGKSETNAQLWPVYHSGAGGRDLVFNTNASSTAPTGNYKSTASSVSTGLWQGVVAGNGIYVAFQKGAASANSVQVSTDGKNWTDHTVTTMPVSGVNTGFISMVFCSFLNLFVGIGYTSSFTSPDGVAWTKGTDYGFSVTAKEQMVASTGSILVGLVGGLDTMTSTDGLVWALHAGALTSAQNAIVGGGGTFVTLPTSGGTQAFYSDDGLAWTATTTPLGSRNYRHIAYGGGAFIAASATTGVPPADKTNQLVRSVDAGRTWQAITVATSLSWGGVAYGGGTWLIGGADSSSSGGVITNIVNVSYDGGNTWSVKTLTSSAYWMFWTWDAVGGFVGRSFAVGSTLSQSAEVAQGSAYFFNPTSTTIDVGAAINALQDYVLYLWASKPGVSKVGTYIGNGTSININCGFASSARFVMIKKLDSFGSWLVWDSTRGINAGAAVDPFIALEQTSQEYTTDNAMAPFASGFTALQTTASNINVSGGQYAFIAIA